jgi:LmbE family N-acetylglucosaminyl deacetylase
VFDWQTQSVLARGPQRIAAVMAHPDDADFICAASCARWASEGHEVTYIVITNGNKGSDDRSLSGDELVEIRKAEQRAAAAILGVKDVLFMGLDDGMLTPSLETRKEVVRALRRVRPDVVICQSPNTFYYGDSYINHPDHRAAGTVVMEAVFPAARNHRYFPELLEEGLEPYKTSEVWISEDQGIDTWVDVTDFLDLKIAALRAHPGQMGDWDPEEMVRKWATESGANATPPVKYAEDYKVMRLHEDESE